MKIFLQHMKGMLGTDPVLEFDPTCLYPTIHQLTPLQDVFSLQEIEEAIQRLAKNKASGPDGLPAEFAQTYWNEIKEETVLIIQKLCNDTFNLEPLNQANIIMIPKSDGANQVGQFRSISIINLIPKIITKILSTRLSNHLPNLIAAKQTTFIKGRQISENFVATREILQHMSQTKNPAVFLKLDFAKAFD